MPHHPRFRRRERQMLHHPRPRPERFTTERVMEIIERVMEMTHRTAARRPTSHIRPRRQVFKLEAKPYRLTHAQPHPCILPAITPRHPRRSVMNRGCPLPLVSPSRRPPVSEPRVCRVNGRSSSSIYSSKKNALLARVRGPSMSRTRRGTRCRPLESCPFAGVPESVA